VVLQPALVLLGLCLLFFNMFQEMNLVELHKPFLYTCKSNYYGLLAKSKFLLLAFWPQTSNVVVVLQSPAWPPQQTL